MNAVWAVIFAGVLGFWAAVSILRQKEQSRELDGEMKQRRKEIRKTAQLITTHTPRDFGGCGGCRTATLAAAKLRQLHTTLAVRLSPDGKSDLVLLQALDDLIADIEAGRTGSRKHAEVVSLISTVLAEQESGNNYGSSVLETAAKAGNWLSNLQEYLTEYDRAKKTN